MPTVIFDVDGVLVDSLQAHWQFNLDQAKKHGVALKVNDVAIDINHEIKNVAAAPMAEFLRRAGFPDDIIPTVLKAYEDTFADKYECKPFHGVADMLKTLCNRGVALGVVSSNTRRNVSKNLGRLSGYFQFAATLGDYPNKTAALTHAKQRFSWPLTFVGDMESDWSAAQSTNINFVGALYGWGIKEDEKRFVTVASVLELQEYLLL